MGAYGVAHDVGHPPARRARVPPASRGGRPIAKLARAPFDPAAPARAPGAVAAEAPRRAAGRLIRVLFGVLPLVWVARHITLQDVTRELRHVGFAGLALAWGLLLCGMLVGALRWRVLLLGYAARDVPRVAALARLLLVGAYFNLLPGGVAGEGVRAARVQAQVGGLVASFNVLVVERVVGLVALLAYAAAASVLVPTEGHVVVARCMQAGFGLALVIAGTVFALPYALDRLPGLRRTASGSRGMGALLGRLRPAARPALLGASLALSLVTQGLALAALFAITRSMSETSPASILGVLPLVVLATHVPLAPAGVGQREAAFVYFYGLVGVSASLAVGTSAVVTLVTLLFSLMGGLCYWLEKV